MRAPAFPSDEAARLADLRAYEVLDSEREPAFDRLTSLAAQLFDVPIALVSLVDEARQWFKAEHGLGAKETPRDISFCGHAIHGKTPLVVPDAMEDERFSDNPLVRGDPRIRFYAGAPLTTPRGHNVGTLCIIDRKPRSLTPLQQQVLTDLAKLVVDQLELRAARFELERETQELQSLLSAFPVPIVVVSEGRYVFANTRADELFGRPSGELTGKDYPPTIHPEERAASLRTEQAAREGKRPIGTARRRLLRPSGEVVTVESTSLRLHWSGRPAVIVALRDLTEELREHELREELARQTQSQLDLMRRAFEVLPDGIVLFDPSFRCVYTNKAMADMLAVKVDTILGWTPEDAGNHLRTLAMDAEDVSAKLPALRDVGHKASVFTLAKPYPRVLRRTLHALGSPTHPWLSVWNDITYEAEQLARKEEEAFTDPLTQLPNRRNIDRVLERAVANGGRMSVVLFDIDHFKRVNDTHGHPVGDEVLRLVAKAVGGVARGGDLVGRWGGEEFIAVLRCDAEGARIFAERARQAVAALQTPAGKVTVSGGIAQAAPSVDVVHAADAQLYEAKRQGRNQIRG